MKKLLVLLFLVTGLAIAGLRDDMADVVHQFYEPGVGSCSAVVIAPDYVLTARHCMNMNSPVLEIKGVKYPAVEAWGNPNLDLALVYIPNVPCPCAKATPDLVKAGDIVYIVGFPYAIGKVVTSGEVQGRVMINGIEHVMTTAPARPGNSGGGVFNDKGELVGILVMGDVSGYLTFFVEIAPLLGSLTSDNETNSPSN